MAIQPNYKLKLTPDSGWSVTGFRELWQYRDLIYFFIWRDVKVRYKQTVLGVFWAIIRPVVNMILFTFLFSELADIPSNGIPYPVFSFAALVPWSFFAGSLSQTTSSVVGNSGLLRKVYFPRLIIPLTASIKGITDFLLAFGLLLILMVLFGITPTLNIVWLPFFWLVALITGLGVGLWLAPLNVKVRDVGQLVPYLIQTWMYLSPVIYPTSLIKNETLLFLFKINPMAGVVEGFRWALLGTDTRPGLEFFLGTLLSILILISGLYFFHRMEKGFGDLA